MSKNLFVSTPLRYFYRNNDQFKETDSNTPRLDHFLRLGSLLHLLHSRISRTPYVVAVQTHHSFEMNNCQTICTCI